MTRTVAVVGGGCSGVLVTRELLRGGEDDVVLIEPGEPGGGIAYGAARPWHLLNSRAGAMSADPDDPDHFVRWAGTTAAAFRPRAEYGRYLLAVLDEADRDHPGRFRVRRAWVSAIGPEGAIALDDGGVLHADHVVLATGGPGAARQQIEHRAYVADPWRPGALEALPADRPVLLVGTGLTAVDVALTLTLTADRHRTAPVVAVSRRGLLPLTHTADATPPTVPSLDDCATLRDVVRAVRAAAGEAGDWRGVVDGLRPLLDQLWTALTPGEQDAFLRHLARPWECHRHRMAPEVAARVVELRAAGLLEIRAGGVAAWPGLADFAAVVNCAGPGRLPGAAGPLIGGLLAAGLARVGPHGLGLDIDEAGRLIGAAGRAHDRLWVVGALRRGARWETTAVPEIRAQARRLAADMGAQHAAPVLAAA